MLYWLALTARLMREQAELRPRDIAEQVKVDASTVYRFEQGKRWPTDPDLMVAAYAAALDLGDSREIWRIAGDLYLDRGFPATISDLRGPDLDPPLEVVQAIEEAASQASRRKPARRAQRRGARAS